MECRDARPSTEPTIASCNSEPTTASLSKTLSDLSAASEALEDRSPSSSQADNPSELPLLDPSFPLPAEVSAQQLCQLSSQGDSSSDQLPFDSLSNEYSYGKAHRSSSHEPSVMYPQNNLLPSQAPAEGLWQNPSVEAGCHESSASDEVSEQPWLSTSANQISHANPLELPYQASTEEEQEVPDDVKREMLKERCKGVAILSCKSEAMGAPCYVYLIGTAHVSEESCRVVRAAISLMEPEVVFVELCQKRSFILRRAHFSVPTISDILATLKEQRSNLLGVLYSWFLGKVATKLDVFPGSEFRAAYQEATACGAKVVLGDRDIEVTLRRTWGKMSTWHKTKFITTMVFQAFCLPKAEQLNELIEKLQDADMLTLAFEELGKSFPTLMETLIDERDMFMAAVLQKLGEENSSIVAVVGRGHVAGIIKHWGQDIPIHNLLEIPQKKSIWNATRKLYVLSALVALVALTITILFVYFRSGS